MKKGNPYDLNEHGGFKERPRISPDKLSTFVKKEIKVINELEKHPMYDLKLNEEYIIPNTTYEDHIHILIRRVPSGWVYEYYEKNAKYVVNSVFVPYAGSHMYSDEL